MQRIDKIGTQDRSQDRFSYAPKEMLRRKSSRTNRISSYRMTCRTCRDSHLWIDCGCGCGNILTKRDNKYRERSHIFGHQTKTGDGNPNWKGGVVPYFKYINEYAPDHHFARKKYVMQHRLVWERANNAVLLPWAHIHHINGKKRDNRIENLNALMPSAHHKLHTRSNTLLQRN